MFKRILVPLDSSRLDTQALLCATEVAQRFNADVILIHVVIPAALSSTAADSGTGMESAVTAETAAEVALEEDKNNVAHAKRYLSRKLREIRSKGIKGSYKVVAGSPAPSITEFSKKEHIDLVVMTTHGRRGLKRAILGSVADAVIRESGKPVMAIRLQTSSEKLICKSYRKWEVIFTTLVLTWRAPDSATTC